MQLECTVCNLIKPITEFHLHRNTARGYAYNCKCCKKARSKTWYIKNAEREILRSAEYKLNHKTAVKAKQRLWTQKNAKRLNQKAKDKRRANPEPFYASDLKRDFGITLETYKQIAETQNNTCAICKKPESAIRQGRIKRLAVDHCHKTLKIRGLLCVRCNTALGMFKDDIDVMHTAIEYIRRARA